MYLGTIPKIDEAVKLIIITLEVGIWVTGLGKLAIGITILRIIGETSKWQKWAVWIVMGLTVSTCIVDFCLTLFRCGDPSIAWTVEAWATATCISETAGSNFNIFSNAVQVLADFAFSIIPMTVVWGMRMSLTLRRRIYLAVALGLTLVTGAAGTVKMVLAATLDPADITYNTYPVLIWFGTESMLIVVCGSVPSLYPLYERYIRGPRGDTEKLVSSTSTYVYSNSNSSKWSKLSSKLRSKQNVSFGTTQGSEDQRSDVELARMAGNHVQAPATAVSATSKYPDSWLYDDGEGGGIHVVSEVDVNSGRISQSRREDV